MQPIAALPEAELSVVGLRGRDQPGDCEHQYERWDDGNNHPQRVDRLLRSYFAFQALTLLTREMCTACEGLSASRYAKAKVASFFHGLQWCFQHMDRFPLKSFVQAEGGTKHWKTKPVCGRLILAVSETQGCAHPLQVARAQHAFGDGRIRTAPAEQVTVTLVTYDANCVWTHGAGTAPENGWRTIAVQDLCGVYNHDTLVATFTAAVERVARKHGATAAEIKIQ